MSTDAFSQEHTSGYVEPFLRWLLPHLAHRQIVHIHHIIRKCAHFTEYFIFCIFLFRAIRGARIGWHWTWGITALIIAAGYACLDEIHQAFVASRTATPWDSLLDSIGAFVAYLALFTYFHLRKPSPPPSTSEAAYSSSSTRALPARSRRGAALLRPSLPGRKPHRSSIFYFFIGDTLAQA
jgi:VanZ family protein